ncbi:hypothetical protein LTR09_005503 [Extremus antarcticus]|uniref:DUF4470 domain-containing protein n=1 Tax=Extremus antarcticus TaxID=702011 RepID=A0AAJ0DG27_9PEZI|nr:hypothetical protein LTR09_005503 [Extremus antarcticus]
MKLLFAGYGDLRNVVQSLSSLPASYDKPVTMVVNDMDFDVVARNLIMLLILMSLEDEAEAVDCVLHLWYSTMIRQSHLDILKTHIRPLIKKVVKDMHKPASGGLIANTWVFGHCIPPGLDATKASVIRLSATLSPGSDDFFMRTMLVQKPAHRMGLDEYRRNGIMLPLGHSREGFQVPNPTYFQSGSWPLADQMKPVDGWLMSDVLSTSNGPAINDVNGKLYHHVRNKLTLFRHRFAHHECHFHMLNVHAEGMPFYFKDLPFDRIEVSNISDRGYMGVREVIAHLSPLLRAPQDNPHATLITLFMSAVSDSWTTKEGGKSSDAELLRASLYLGRPVFETTGPPILKSDPFYALIMASMQLVRNGDEYCDKYMTTYKFKNVERDFGVAMKEPHTVLGKWPLGLKIPPRQPGWKEEFEQLRATYSRGVERYVEWKKIK